MSKILVIGDNATDCFIRVDAKKFAPEGPWPAVTPHSISTNPGMAGNVAANVASLGPEHTVFVIFSEHESVKTRYVDRKTNHHFLRVDQDFYSAPLSDNTPLLDADIVLLSDYKKGLLNENNMKWISDYYFSRGVPVLCDTKAILNNWSSDLIVKINASEFDEQLKAGVAPWEKCAHLIVTRGPDGMDLYGRDGSIIHHEDSVGGDVVDVAGAGDSVLAAIAVNYLETKDLVAAMRFASKVAAVAVSKRGVVAVKMEEII